MHILYIIFIYPLELLMKTILEFSYSVTDNYGLSIVILSIIVNIILLPLYYMAEKWKAKDKTLQESMKPEIDNIKKHYKGQERHFYVQTVYRRFGYHPLSSIKASIGFLIQIPFFFAAFHLLSNYQALDGVSFGILKDLGSPDHLIGGINVLPIVMTVVNLLSAYIYIELLNKSEKIQLFALAFIFLVVLYNEPTGLLLYWTMNNVFSLVKNIVEKKLRLRPLFSRTFKRNSETKQLVSTDYIKSIYEKIRVPIWFFLLLAAIGLDRVYNVYLNKINLLYAFESILIFLYLDSLLLLKYFTQSDKKNKFFVALIALLILAVAVFMADYVLHTFVLVSPVHPKESMIIILVAIFILLSTDHLVKFFDRKFLQNFYPSFKIFTLTYISIFLLIYFVNPIAIYISTDDFSIAINMLLTNMFIWLIASLCVFYFLYHMSNKSFKKVLIIVGLNGLLLSLLYSFVIVKDYGLLDHFVFNVPANLLMSRLENTIEISLIVIFILLFSFIIIKFSSIIEKILFATLIMLLSYIFFNTVNIQTRETSRYETQFKTEEGSTLSLSKKENILVFFLDGFSGGDLEKIFREKKEVFSEYDGFVRYKNVLTVGNGTWGSILSMFGGHQFTVEAINNRPGETLREKAKNAYDVFPNTFLPRNWAITYLYPQFAHDINKSVNMPTFDYGGYYLDKSNIKLNEEEILKKESKMILRVSIFKIIPWSLKGILYNHGRWRIKGNKQRYIKYKAKYWGFLNIFHESMNFTNEKRTLKYFQLGIPHGPNVISEKGTLRGKSSFYIESYVTLNKLGQIFKKLKQNNVYDNTKIVIVSDHGWWRDNPNFPNNFAKIIPKGKENRMNVGMLNPILLVKDFNATGKIKTSDKFMSNADVPAIICSKLSNKCDIDDVDPTKLDLNRILTVSTVGSTDMKKGNVFELHDQYEVKNNIFDPYNWTKIK